MAIGTYQFELQNDTFYWAYAPSSPVTNVYWGNILVAQVFGTEPSSVTTVYGTFYKGTLQSSDSTYDYSSVAKESLPGTVIYGADYNAVQVKVDGILGDGTYYGGPNNGYGYGQSIITSTVSPTDIIAEDEWYDLLAELNKIYVHQYGVSSTTIAAAQSLASTGNPILYEVLNLVDGLASGAVNNKALCAANQKTITTGIIEPLVNLVWGGSDDTPLVGSETTPSSVDSSFDITFASEADLHYFFNSGGTVTITGKRDTGATGLTAQEQAWYNLIPSLAVSVNTAVVSILSGETLIDTGQSTTTPYTGAEFNVYATYNTNKITVRVLFTDNHLPTGQGPDFIRANLIGYSVAMSAITGAYNGGFDVTSPSIAVVETFA